MRKKIEYDHLSISQINEYSICPRFYYYHRVVGSYIPPYYLPASGKLIHDGLEEHNKERVRGRKGLTPSQILEIAVTGLESMPNVSDLDLPLGKAKDKLVLDGTPPTGRYLGVTERVFDELPVGEDDVERLMEFEFAGYKFVGYADLVLPSRIVDYKLVGRRKSAKEVLIDPQLHLYTHVLGRPASFVQLVRGKEIAEHTPQPQEERMARGVLGWVADTAKAIETSKQTDVWPRCSPGHWKCSKERCPFWGRCFPRKKQSKEKTEAPGKEKQAVAV